jgi:hypothetical protein
MPGSSRTWKWYWLVFTAVVLVFLVLNVVQGEILAASGLFCLLVSGVLYASGVPERSQPLYYLAVGFSLLGILLIVGSTEFILDPFW